MRSNAPMNMLLSTCACTILSASIAAAAPETAQLRHIAADEAMRECLASLLHSQGERGPVPSSLAIEKVRVGETSLSVDHRSNQLSFDGPEGDRELLRAVLKAVDVRRDSFLIEAVVVEVTGLDFAGDLIKWRPRPDGAFIVDSDQESFSKLVDRLGRDEHCAILAMPHVHVRDNSESIISKGDGRGSLGIKLKARGGSAGQITLEVSGSRVVGESRSELSSYARLSDGGTLVLGGFVDGDKELLVLISPSLDSRVPKAEK